MYRKFLLCLISAVVLSLPISEALAGQNQFHITWRDNSTNEALFKIERCSNGAPNNCQPANFVQIGTVGSDIVSYTDSGLPDSTPFCYRLRAWNAGGDSPYSPVACGVTNPPLPPNPPNPPSQINLQ